MERVYDPKASEAKWQRRWEEARVYEVDLKAAKDPYYALVMFPYPSGDKLHVGHWYNFGPADSYFRFMRLQGKTVFEPMGFDAFGLPAENYAIKTGIYPARSTAENVQTMIRQLKQIGCMYDWSKAMDTSHPDYYRWTQWLFLKMYEHGLAYKKGAPVNFCPSCQTVLANEQAQDGLCERCSTPVIQKSLNQWFWKITAYAQKLLDNLGRLDWPEKTKLMQRNWIGRSEGAEIRFVVDGYQETITVFTTRPDTLFGATYLVLAPEHPLVEKIVAENHRTSVEAYKREVMKKTELQRTDLARQKAGVPTGAFALHPVTGEKLPIWIADYVLVHYGTGAIMAVPGHDERDWQFARAFKLPIAEVVEGGNIDEGAFTVDGIAVHSDFLNGFPTHEAKKRMISWLEDHGRGRLHVTYRLRDWLVSRQRYWGAPIPIVYDPQGKPHPIPEEHLPWLLPTDVEFKPTGESPLKHSKEFRQRTERLFGKGWTPEFDTMDTFVCSSFYYLRYLQESLSQEKSQIPSIKSQASSKFQAPNSKQTILNSPRATVQSTERLVEPEIERKWMPVSMYIGGSEHACMHLIYARFVMMALRDFGVVSHEEPFAVLRHQGVITNKGAKMSKSRGNVVSPDDFVQRYGSDVFRMYLMFKGPYEEGGDWSDLGIKGMDRFVQRVWRLMRGSQAPSSKIQESKGGEFKGKSLSKKVIQKDEFAFVAALHAAIKKVTEDIGKLDFNTAIAALMVLLNLAEEQSSISLESKKIFPLLLAPLAPHLAEELWEALGGKGLVMEQRWPAYDPKLLVKKMVTVVVQVNGKVRANVEAGTDASEAEIIVAAKAQENVRRHLEGRKLVRHVYVPGKLVNFVV